MSTQMSPATGAEFVAALVPSVTIAKAATQLVSFLVLDRVAEMNPGSREKLVDSFLSSQIEPDASPQARAKMRSIAYRAVGSVDLKDPIWATMPATRAFIALAATQSALETAANLARVVLCEKANGKECNHKVRGFQQKWQHAVEALRKLDRKAESTVSAHWSDVIRLVELRNDLVHGTPREEDRAFVESTKPTPMVQPLFDAREALVEAVLRYAYEDADPKRTSANGIILAWKLPADTFDGLTP